MQYNHQTVLLNEAVSSLNIKPNGIYVDGTFGRGGHSMLILSKLGAKGRLIAIDRDTRAIDAAKQIIDPRFSIIHGEFSRVDEYIKALNLMGKIDGFLLDLGVSSPQIDDPNRGFSFMRDGPLDMRMDVTKGITASEWLFNTDEADIAFVLKTFGEEKFAKRVAKAIKQQNQQKIMTTTKELADLIDKTLPVKERHKHPATRSFQAIRIYINSELKEVESALDASINILSADAKLAVISFHSLEDRIVKQFIAKESKPPLLPKGLPLTNSEISKLSQINFKKGAKIKPTQQEIMQNPRSRSAILRVATRINKTDD